MNVLVEEVERLGELAELKIGTRHVALDFLDKLIGSRGVKAVTPKQRKCGATRYAAAALMLAVQHNPEIGMTLSELCLRTGLEPHTASIRRQYNALCALLVQYRQQHDDSYHFDVGRMCSGGGGIEKQEQQEPRAVEQLQDCKGQVSRIVHRMDLGNKVCATCYGLPQQVVQFIQKATVAVDDVQRYVVLVHAIWKTFIAHTIGGQCVQCKERSTHEMFAERLCTASGASSRIMLADIRRMHMCCGGNDVS